MTEHNHADDQQDPRASLWRDYNERQVGSAPKPLLMRVLQRSRSPRTYWREGGSPLLGNGVVGHRQLVHADRVGHRFTGRRQQHVVFLAGEVHGPWPA